MKRAVPDLCLFELYGLFLARESFTQRLQCISEPPYISLNCLDLNRPWGTDMTFSTRNICGSVYEKNVCNIFTPIILIIARSHNWLFYCLQQVALNPGNCWLSDQRNELYSERKQCFRLSLVLWTAPDSRGFIVQGQWISTCYKVWQILLWKRLFPNLW